MLTNSILRTGMTLYIIDLVANFFVKIFCAFIGAYIICIDSMTVILAKYRMRLTFSNCRDNIISGYINYPKNQHKEQQGTLQSPPVVVSKLLEFFQN